MVYDPYQQKKKKQTRATSTNRQVGIMSTNNTPDLDELADRARQTPQYDDRDRQFSRLEYLDRIAQQRREQMQPQVNAQQRRVSKQYADLGRRIKEEAANLGMLRSGRVMNKLLPNVGRDKVRALSAIEQGAMQQAYEQAFPIAQFGLSEQQYLDSLKNQQAQQLFNNLLNVYGLQTSQNRWQQEFDLDRALAEAGLTGRYGGEETLARRGQMLDILNALMNYNLGVGRITDDLPMPTEFNYGDLMVELLNRLGVNQNG